MDRHDFLNKIEGRSGRESRQQVGLRNNARIHPGEHISQDHGALIKPRETDPVMPGPGSTVTAHPSYTPGSLGKISGHGKGPP